MINNFTFRFKSRVYTLLFYYTILAFKVCDTIKKTYWNFFKNVELIDWNTCTYCGNKMFTIYNYSLCFKKTEEKKTVSSHCFSKT